MVRQLFENCMGNENSGRVEETGFRYLCQAFKPFLGWKYKQTETTNDEGLHVGI